MKAQEYYDEFSKELEKLTDNELVERFNNEVGNKGWVTARASLLRAVHDEFDKRGFNYTEIGNEESLSFQNKIELIKKNIILKR